MQLKVGSAAAAFSATDPVPVKLQTRLNQQKALVRIRKREMAAAEEEETTSIKAVAALLSVAPFEFRYRD